MSSREDEGPLEKGTSGKRHAQGENDVFFKCKNRFIRISCLFKNRFPVLMQTGNGGLGGSALTT